MISAEITPYGDSSSDPSVPATRTLYRYAGAEHIGVGYFTEDNRTIYELYFSTEADSIVVQAAYEDIFATHAIVGEVEPEERPTTDGFESREITKSSSFTIALGPYGRQIARTNSFSLSWKRAYKIWFDRPDETADVHMYQWDEPFDFRHKEMVRRLGHSLVVRELDLTLDFM